MLTKISHLYKFSTIFFPIRAYALHWYSLTPLKPNRSLYFMSCSAYFAQIGKESNVGVADYVEMRSMTRYRKKHCGQTSRFCWNVHLLFVSLPSTTRSHHIYILS